MSKIIDVRPGDTWTIRTNTGELIQYRNGDRIRYVCPSTAEKPLRVQPTDDEVSIVYWAVENIVRGWGYTLIPAAKPEAKPADAPAVKENLTTDVPVVDAVWAEDKNGRLCGYGHWNAMHAIWGYDVRSGTARIVRLAPDPDLAATVKRVEETVNLVREAATKNAMYCNELERRVAKLEAVIAEAQSLLNESPKAATTPAKVRVVLPEIPGWATDDRVTAGWNSCIVQVKLALSAAGVEVKEASK
jgi:hypothetical protein